MIGIFLVRAHAIRFAMFATARSSLGLRTNMSYCMSMTSNATPVMYAAPAPSNAHEIVEKRFTGKRGLAVEHGTAARTNEQAQDSSRSLHAICANCCVG